MSITFFGQYLLKGGLIEGWQLVVAVDRQKRVNIKIGTRAIEAGIMTPMQVHRVNRIQRTTDRRFGELAVEDGALAREQLNELLRKSQEEHLFLGEALVNMKALTPAQLAEHLEKFKKSTESSPARIADLYFDRPNSEVLEISTDVIVKMFSRLIHIDVRPGRCHDDPAGISPADYSLSQRFSGDFTGEIFLNISRSMLATMSRELMDLERKELDEESLADAVEFINVACGNICARLSAVGKQAEIEAPRFHSQQSGPVDFAAVSEAKLFAVTPLLHPEETIEFCVIDDSLLKSK